MTVVRHGTEFRIEKATIEDADDFADVLVAAFRSNAVNHLILPDPATWHGRFLDALKKIWKHPTARPLKAVDNASDKIIGAAVWASLNGELLASQHNLLAHAFATPFSRDLGHESQHPTPGEKLQVRVRTELRAAQQRWIEGKACEYLAIVGVHPSRQGHGIGEALVQVGMKRANKRQVACFLEATPAGYPVYKKLGWNKVDEDIDIDLSEYGGEHSGYGPVRYRCMLKLPDKNVQSM